MRTIAAILLCCASAFGQTLNVGTVANVGTLTKRDASAPAGDCDTSKDSYATGTSVFDNTSYKYLSGSFTPASSYTICKLTVSLCKSNSPSGTIQALIYTSSTDHPGTVIGTGSTEYNATALSATQADFTFEGLSAAVTSGTLYFIVIKCSANGDANNNVKMFYGYTGETDYISVSDNGSSWDLAENSFQVRFNTYAQ